MNKPKNNYTPGPQDVMLTPPHAIEPLLPFIPQHWVIWESASNETDPPDSLLARSFRQKGYNVISTGLPITDYFTTSPSIYAYDIQVTNPPFSLKYKWLKRAFELGMRFALLVPYETTFAAEFNKLFKEHNNNPYTIEKLSPQRRINFKTPNYGWGKLVWDEVKQKFIKRGASAQMPTCWITWGLDVAYTKSPDEILYEYVVDMRSVQYDEHDNEIK